MGPLRQHQTPQQLLHLCLEANDNLTWREVKHILATTAEQVHPSINVGYKNDT